MREKIYTLKLTIGDISLIETYVGCDYGTDDMRTNRLMAKIQKQVDKQKY